MATKQNYATPEAAEAAAPPVAGGRNTARLTNYHVKPAYQAKFRQVLGEYVFNSLSAAGNIMAEAYAELDEPSRFWLIERWSSPALLEGSQPTAALASLVQEALVAPAEILLVQDLEPLSKVDWQRAPEAADQPMTVMLFVDAKAGTGAEFKRRYHAAMPQIRGEAGVVTYQLTQVQGTDDKFITYEKFRSPQALQDHLKLPFLAPILDFLHTSIINPPFEQGLHKLTELAPLQWQ